MQEDGKYFSKVYFVLLRNLITDPILSHNIYLELFCQSKITHTFLDTLLFIFQAQLVEIAVPFKLNGFGCCSLSYLFISCLSPISHLL